VEPLINGYVQKGTDQVMRRRLKRVGIDLSDQEINQAMALSGSLAWEDSTGFVTIDLKSASDSISKELVRLLLPPSWFSFLESIRSPEYELNGERKAYHKFCSMGNGFCFPLETLLFTAACQAVGCKDRSTRHVYGDDIIVPGNVAEELIHLLSVMGFEVNTKKTCISGPFRESCGGNYFAGVDVSPFTLDFRFDSVEAVFKFFNLTQRNSFTTSYFAEARDRILDLLPSEYRLFRPCEGNDDTGLSGSMDQFLSSHYARWLADTQTWGWKELSHYSVSDNEWRKLKSSDILLRIAVLRGGNSHQPYTYRRKTRSKLCKIRNGLGFSQFWLVRNVRLAYMRFGTEWRWRESRSSLRLRS
jgi:hypothetical protein